LRPFSFGASLSFALLAFPSLSIAQRIERRGADAILVLPRAMQAALHAFDSTFAPRRLSDYAPWHYYYPCPAPPDCPKPWYQITDRQALFAAAGDFNGDKILDVVLDGDNGREGARLVIMSDGSRFRVEQVHPLEVVPPEIRQFRARPRAANEAELGLGEGLSVTSRRRPRSTIIATGAGPHTRRAIEPGRAVRQPDNDHSGTIRLADRTGR
jgi:hypothetical protein